MRKYFYFAMVLLSLVFAAIVVSRAQDPQSGVPLKEFRPIGGLHNNLLHPEYDATPGSAEVNFAPLRFANPATLEPMPGPNPRAVGQLVAGAGAAPAADAVASPWLYLFGTFVRLDLSHEFSSPQGPPIHITVPPGDPDLPAGGIIAMTRDIKSPRTHTAINTAAGYLDLSQLYGSTAEVAASLRARDGPLKTSNDGQALQVVDGRFMAGDPRVNDNPDISMATMLFMREHNYWVAELKRLHPDWTGNNYYQMARAITTAEYQNIVYAEFLPVLIGPVLGPYLGYDARVNAQVTQEFSSAAFRLGSAQVPVDLAAVAIQRGRDHGLNTLNQTRTSLGLAPYVSFAELTADQGLQSQLQALYGSVDQVELYVGGLAERHAGSALVGETFREILHRQFHALRAGDRFFWASQGFEQDLAARIANTTLGEIIRRNSEVAQVPANVFLAEGPRHDRLAPADNRTQYGGPFIIP